MAFKIAGLGAARGAAGGGVLDIAKQRLAGRPRPGQVLSPPQGGGDTRGAALEAPKPALPQQQPANLAAQGVSASDALKRGVGGANVLWEKQQPAASLPKPMTQAVPQATPVTAPPAVSKFQPGPGAPPRPSGPEPTIEPPRPPPPGQPQPQPAGTQNAPISIANLGGVIERQLANPSRYDAETAMKIRAQMKADLGDEAKLSRDRAIANAASRGVYYGSPLTTSLGDIEERLARAQGAADVNLLREQATTYGSDVERATQAAMRFGENAAQLPLQRGQFGLNVLQAGREGGPTIPGSLGAIAGAPGPQMPDYSGLLGALGGVAAGGLNRGGGGSESSVVRPAAGPGAAPIGQLPTPQVGPFPTPDIGTPMPTDFIGAPPSRPAPFSRYDPTKPESRSNVPPGGFSYNQSPFPKQNNAAPAAARLTPELAAAMQSGTGLLSSGTAAPPLQGGGDIARAEAMAGSRISPQQISQVTGVPLAQVEQMANRRRAASLPRGFPQQRQPAGIEGEL